MLKFNTFYSNITLLTKKVITTEDSILNDFFIKKWFFNSASVLLHSFMNSASNVSVMY